MTIKPPELYNSSSREQLVLQPEEKAIMETFLSGKALLFYAPPNSGKGTLSNWVNSQFATSCIVSSSTALEKSDEAKVYMDSGRNVPSNIAAPILEKLWAYIPKKLESGNIIVLDGVVRTPEQVTTAELRNIPFLRVVFEVSRKHLFIRGDKRVVCPICRFSTDKSGYCPKHPTTVLVKRSDDSEDKLQARIEEYNRDIPQILELYDSSNTPYYWLNANGSKREVQRNFKHLCLNLSKK